MPVISCDSAMPLSIGNVWMYRDGQRSCIDDDLDSENNPKRTVPSSVCVKVVVNGSESMSPPALLLAGTKARTVWMRGLIYVRARREGLGCRSV
jgi:hypothetical protein